MSKILVQGKEISIFRKEHTDYISLTDIAKYRNKNAPTDIIKNWICNKSTVELLGLWEKLNNPDFKQVEFDLFKNEAGANYFVLSQKKWIETTNAKGLVSKSGRYGGTYAHKDIALEFASWISVEFKLYFIKEFQRLKEEENRTKSLEWNLQRTLSKINYRIHTDAVKEKLIPPELTRKQINFIYANEADLLNVALFGKTAQEWRVENPEIKGNIRDYASIEQLVVLTNPESINAVLIHNE